MREPLVLVTGFGSFERFAVNPTEEVVRALVAEPPPGVRLRTAVLPVSFARAPEEWEALLAAGDPPDLALSLGVASRGTTFRLERRATPQLLRVPRPDVDGRSAAEFSREGPPRTTRVDLAELVAALAPCGLADVEVSDSAGGYVCEHLYHHVLGRARALGLPALFLHVPAPPHATAERALALVRAVIAALVPRQARTTRG